MSTDETTQPRTKPVVRTEVDGESGTLALLGEIDHSTADQLDAAVADLLDAGVRTFAVDFASLTFFDSACIGALVRMHETIAEKGGTVTLVNVNKRALRIIELTGLLTQFDVKTVDDE